MIGQRGFRALAADKARENAGNRGNELLFYDVSFEAGGEIQHQHAKQLVARQDRYAVMTVIGNSRIGDLMALIHTVGILHLPAGSGAATVAAAKRHAVAERHDFR